MTSCNLLLVEDDDGLRRVLARVLSRAGFAVRPTGTCRGARALASAEIDLVVTDVELPDGDGVELARELTSGRSDLPVLLMSGAGSLEEPTALDARFLPKPFLPGELLAEVRTLLRGTSARAHPPGGVRDSSHADTAAGEGSRRLVDERLRALRVVREMVRRDRLEEVPDEPRERDHVAYG